MHEFRLNPGSFFPEEGGYLFLSGLSRKFPFLHGRESLQIAPIRGARSSRRGFLVTDRSSVLHIRGLSDEEASTLSGSWFQVEDALMGMSQGKKLDVKAAPALVSRLVVFEAESGDNPQNHEWFLSKLARVAPVGCGMTLGRQRTIRVKGRTFLGYGVRLSDLTTEASEAVQLNGIGRFTSMGCGVFAPARMA